MNPFEGLRRNTAINFAGLVLPLVVSFVTVPFYVRVIGPQRYGVLLIVWAFLGYFGAFDLGLSRAVANRIAQLKDASAQARSQVIWTGLFLGLGVGFVGGAAMVGAGYVFTGELLDLAPELRREAMSALLWLGVAVPLSNAMWLLVGSLEGQERFVLANGVTVASVTFSQALPLTLGLLTSSSLQWMLTGVALASLLGLLIALAVCARTVPLGRPGGLDRSVAAGLARYGGWVMVSGIASPVLATVDRVVIGAVRGAQAVTVYAVPSNLVNRIGIVPLSLARTLFPRLSLLESDSAALVLRQAVLALLVLMTPLSVVTMFALEPFLRLWIGEALAPEASRVGQIVLLGAFASATASVPYTYLQARGRPDLPAKFHLLELVPYLALLWVGLRFAGIEGAAWATTFRMTVDACLLCWRASLPRRAVDAVALAALPVALAYTIVATAGEDDAVRMIASVLVTAASIGVSLRVRRQLQRDAGFGRAPEPEHSGERPVPSVAPVGESGVPSELPLVSIVTPVLNGSRFVEETVRSVEAQDYPRIEHIVIDGGSTDGTLEVLARYPKVRTVSKPGESLASRVNTGFAMAKGEIVGWLNADDLYLAGAVTAAVSELIAGQHLGLVCADHVEIDASGNRLRRVDSPEVDLDVLLNRGNTISQPTVFLRRRAIETVGGLNERYQYTIDYELWLRLVSAFPAKHVPECWVAFRRHDNQMTAVHGHAFGREIRRASLANGGRFFSDLGFTHSKPLRAIRRVRRGLFAGSCP